MFIDATVKSVRRNDANAANLNRAQRETTARLRNPELAIYEPKRAQVVRAASYGTMRSHPAARRYTTWFSPDGGISAYEIEEVV